MLLTFQNEGWAAPFNPRAVDLILRNRQGGAIHCFPLDAEPRLWLPGRSAVLHLTAANMRLRLANDGIWKAVTGYPRLGVAVKVAPR